MTQYWPHIRAVLVALHLVAITVMALPAPGAGLNRAAWADPTVQGEFRSWTQRLNGWGVQITQKELEDRAYTFAKRYDGVRNVVLKPARPYYRYFGTYQSWRMFVAPMRYPARLEVDALAGGKDDWAPVYRARSGQHDFLSHQLNHDRFRAAIFRYGWNTYRRYGKQFARWYARQVFEARPDVVAVRVRFFKYKTPSPQETRQGRLPRGKHILSHTFRRDAVME